MREQRITSKHTQSFNYHSDCVAHQTSQLFSDVMDNFFPVSGFRHMQLSC